MTDARPADTRFETLLTDPYPVYGQLRGQQPTLGAFPAPGYVLARHAHVRTALHDARLSAERPSGIAPTTPGLREQLAVDPAERSMLASDPPDHTRMRALVNRAFTPRRMEALSGRIEAIAQELLARVGAAREVELMSALAGPLPVIVIAELLGIPVRDHCQLREWSSALVALIDGTTEPAAIAAAGLAQRELREYLCGAIAARRREPRDDLLSALIAARDERDALSDPELIATCRLLLIAGHETTTNLIGNGLVALLEHPAQLAALRADPGLGRSAVEELLRFDAPVQMTRRVARQALEIGGVTIPAKSLVMLLIGAANRDPDAFAEPDQLDLHREPNPHLSFGHGIHTCLGAPLARLEARIALRALLARFARIELAQPPCRRPTFLLRGYREVRLRVG